MLFLQGSKVYTAFRYQQILSRLQKKTAAITSLDITYHYFVDWPEEQNNAEDQKRLLARLLHEARFYDYPLLSEGVCCWVVPRLGTISSWSSKATDIANNCGIPANRIERGICYVIQGLSEKDKQVKQIVRELYDPLVESILFSFDELKLLFQHSLPKTFTSIDLLEKGEQALREANQNLGMGLSGSDFAYLLSAFRQLNRNPTDVELMMFAQVNSEHCRHKIFNAHWCINGKDESESLFAMIRQTYKESPDSVIVAYNDNAAVVKGSPTKHFLINPITHCYENQEETIHTVLKVETHNHPTAISPFPGAATGSGGEIRDEAATGRGAQSRAGLTGFSVSHLKIPGFIQPWEMQRERPKFLASALEIMLEGPIGSASYNNEFGRPNICGYFRAFEYLDRGYHKPIMIAGGIGHIRASQVKKTIFDEAALLIVIGGPAMSIGLGGGAASSRTSGESTEALDFASVQRANPEMQRRAQEVINTCISLGEANPILSIHDVGAGGLSNALPELVYDSHCGGRFELRDIPNAESGMTPLEIWCNEAQERFVLAIKSQAVQIFRDIARRERCPFAVIGKANQDNQLIVNDACFRNLPIDLPLPVLFENRPRLKCEDNSIYPKTKLLETNNIIWSDAVKRVLQYPCVANKSFLITIGDRTVGGLVARDQMVGPWQVPVADVGVIMQSFEGYRGQALAMGERSPVALLDPRASARMALGEAITNIAAASIDALTQTTLSANWMAATDVSGEGAALYEAVKALTEMCSALGICIPVGKDSLSMRTTWKGEDEQTQSITSPLSLIVTATAPVVDVRHTLTPELQTNQGKTLLLLIDLSGTANRLGASCLAQTYGVLGKCSPDLSNPLLLNAFFKTIQSLNRENLLLAYHDRSDGGLLVTLCEMAFAGRVGMTVELGLLGDEPLAIVFNEELGAVIQIKEKDLKKVLKIIETNELEHYSHLIGKLNDSKEIIFNFRGNTLYQEKVSTLQRWWSETSYRLQALRDNPDCAEQEFNYLLDQENSGLTARLSFDNDKNITQIYINKGIRPRVAILREQGTNGYREMAAAFHLAGFDSVDVHMSDLLNGEISLNNFKGLAACGGFSFGDVLGAGRGWAQSILMNPKVYDEFFLFFHSLDRFALGVCNGCQLFSHLKSLIPGAECWPLFERNISEQFEARLSMVEIVESPSILFKGMAGSQLPIAVAHGEGRVIFQEKEKYEMLEKKLVALQYVNYKGLPTEIYPANPNGSSGGVTGFTTPDGRITIMMPHPERVFLTRQLSWHPSEWEEASPWMQMFHNARRWVE